MRFTEGGGAKYEKSIHDQITVIRLEAIINNRVSKKTLLKVQTPTG